MPITKTSWQKGRSGNPKGRRRSGEELGELLRQIVDRRRFADKLCELCYAGDVQAMRLLLSYTDGPPQAGGPIQDPETIQITVTYVQKIIPLKLAPHPAQLRLIQESQRFNVVCCGRRFGKIVLGMDRLIQTALQGKPVAWFSPTYRLLGDVWRELLCVLAPVILQKSEQEKRLELIGGGVIELWSLDSADAGRSRKYAPVVIDEAAMVPALEQAWQQSIRPTLTDLRGSAWFLSTPKGMNYFKFLFDQGQDPQQSDWAGWQMPTQANPFIDPQEVEAARRDLSETTFNQEYLALFVNWEGAVFRRVVEAASAVRTDPAPDHDYIIGCDWGRTTDYTVFVVLDAHTRATVELDRSNRVDYAVQQGRLRALSDRWHPKQILAESNSIGQPIMEQLTRDGLRVRLFTTTNAGKMEAIEALALAFERGDLRILNDPVLIHELLAYQAELSPSGLRRYGAPSGQHDDCVMALAIAWSPISGQDQAVYTVPECEFIVEPIVIRAHWPREFGMDVGWRSTAVVWAAMDPNTGMWYLYEEYYSPERDPVVLAGELKERGDGFAGSWTLWGTVANGRTGFGCSICTNRPAWI